MTDAQAMLRRLIAFDTTSRRSNLELIDWAADYLDGLGAAIRLTRDANGTKANLLAAIGPERSGGIVLSGHTDVVPVDDQNWSSDPFSLAERDGRLYGRGTADMKSFIACCLAQAKSWAESDLKRPIYLAFSYDEEVGCLGVPGLIADLVRNCPKPALAIVGEPTEMKLIGAHKGACVFRTEVTGRAAHSSAPALGVSAIAGATEFMTFLFELAAEFRETRSSLEGLDPPYTTLNVGTIQGGTALNIIPSTCTLVWEFRPLPEADIAAIRARIDAYVNDVLRPKLKRQWEEADIRTVELAFVPPLRPDPGNDAELLVRRLTGANTASEAVSFGTEAGLFQEAGIPTAVCGPGSITQAHQPDEWIAIEQIEAANKFLDGIGAWASRP